MTNLKHMNLNLWPVNTTEIQQKNIITYEYQAEDPGKL